MQQTPFHAYYVARMLSAYTDNDRLIPAFASSNMEIYPYQIAAAQFALRSSYLKGCVLCSECSLGKTYEALLIMTQQWYEGKNRLLLVLPANMIRQWTAKIENSFSLPYTVLDNEDTWSTALAEDVENPFEQDALVITTYEFAVKKSEYIHKQKWDMTVFDEASRLGGIFDQYGKLSPDINKTAFTLKKAVKNSFKLLLTPTPITKDIMDVYGLLYFIDETVLPDADYFYDRYFRKPENYPELASWVSAYCFRTLKSQVTDYVNFTNRIPYTVDYELTAKEWELYQKIEDYLALPKRYAYPDMNIYRLGVRILYHSISSSPQAFVKTMDKPIGRLRSEGGNEKVKAELDMLLEMQSIAKTIEVNGKSKELVSILKKCFSRLKLQKIKQKAIIFINYLETQDYLYALLADKGYTALKYNGGNSRDYTVMDRFRNDDSIQVLLATDDAAKGLDIEFCPIVFNYDLLFNTIEMEQRVGRCHRQGQKSDVVVVNLLGKVNKTDVRVMELVNKRILQFDGIFGMSDAILGNFDADIEVVLEDVRRVDDIQKAFDANIEEHEDENKRLVSSAEDALFTSFTKEIADKVTVTPQYIEEKIKGINSDLWEVMKWYFKWYNEYEPDPDDFMTKFMNLKKHSCCYEINEQDMTITAHPGEDKLPTLFYYETGSRNKPYVSLERYGMAADFKPHYGRITLTSIFGGGILNAISCSDNGTLTVDADIEPCIIGFYCVEIQSKQDEYAQKYYTLIGKTGSGRILGNEECKGILELPVVDYTEISKKKEQNLSGGANASRELDKLVPVENFKEKCFNERSTAAADEIELMKHRTARLKVGLERTLDKIQTQIAEAEKDVGDNDDRVKQMQAQKKLRVLQREFLEKEENLFLDGMKLDVELENKIAEFIKNEKSNAKAIRQFVLEISGSKGGKQS